MKNKLDRLIKKAAASYLTKEEERELKKLHADKMKFLAKGYEFENPKTRKP